MQKHPECIHHYGQNIFHQTIGYGMHWAGAWELTDLIYRNVLLVKLTSGEKNRSLEQTVQFRGSIYATHHSNPEGFGREWGQFRKMTIWYNQCRGSGGKKLRGGIMGRGIWHLFSGLSWGNLEKNIWQFHGIWIENRNIDNISNPFLLVIYKKRYL